MQQPKCFGCPYVSLLDLMAANCLCPLALVLLSAPRTSNLHVRKLVLIFRCAISRCYVCMLSDRASWLKSSRQTASRFSSTSKESCPLGDRWCPPTFLPVRSCGVYRRDPSSAQVKGRICPWLPGGSRTGASVSAIFSPRVV